MVLRWLGWSAAVATLSIVVLVGTAAPLLARGSGPAIVVFPPGTALSTALDRVDDAGARFVGFGRTGWILAIAEAPESVRAGLRADGWVLLLDGVRAAAICGIRLDIGGSATG